MDTGRALVFFFNDTATTEIYTLSLHDALPIWQHSRPRHRCHGPGQVSDQQPPLRDGEPVHSGGARPGAPTRRSEEHTSELQSRQYLVCRLLLEKKKKTYYSCATTLDSYQVPHA